MRNKRERLREKKRKGERENGRAKERVREGGVRLTQRERKEITEQVRERD